MTLAHAVFRGGLVVEATDINASGLGRRCLLMEITALAPPSSSPANQAVRGQQQQRKPKRPPQRKPKRPPSTGPAVGNLPGRVGPPAQPTKPKTPMPTPTMVPNPATAKKPGTRGMAAGTSGSTAGTPKASKYPPDPHTQDYYKALSDPKHPHHKTTTAHMRGLRDDTEGKAADKVAGEKLASVQGGKNPEKRTGLWNPDQEGALTKGVEGTKKVLRGLKDFATGGGKTSAAMKKGAAAAADKAKKPGLLKRAAQSVADHAGAAARGIVGAPQKGDAPPAGQQGQAQGQQPAAAAKKSAATPKTPAAQSGGQPTPPGGGGGSGSKLHPETGGAHRDDDTTHATVPMQGGGRGKIVHSYGPHPQQLVPHPQNPAFSYDPSAPHRIFGPRNMHGQAPAPVGGGTGAMGGAMGGFHPGASAAGGVPAPQQQQPQGQQQQPQGQEPQGTPGQQDSWWKRALQGVFRHRDLQGQQPPAGADPAAAAAAAAAAGAPPVAAPAPAAAPAATPATPAAPAATPAIPDPINDPAPAKPKPLALRPPARRAAPPIVDPRTVTARQRASGQAPDPAKQAAPRAAQSSQRQAKPVKGGGVTFDPEEQGKREAPPAPGKRTVANAPEGVRRAAERKGVKPAGQQREAPPGERKPRKPRMSKGSKSSSTASFGDEATRIQQDVEAQTGRQTAASGGVSNKERNQTRSDMNAARRKARGLPSESGTAALARERKARGGAREPSKMADFANRVTSKPARSAKPKAADDEIVGLLGPDSSASQAAAKTGRRPSISNKVERKPTLGTKPETGANTGETLSNARKQARKQRGQVASALTTRQGYDHLTGKATKKNPSRLQLDVPRGRGKKGFSADARGRAKDLPSLTSGPKDAPSPRKFAGIPGPKNKPIKARPSANEPQAAKDDRSALKRVRSAIRGEGGYRNVKGSTTLSRAESSSAPKPKKTDSAGNVIKPAETHAKARDRVDAQAAEQGVKGRLGKLPPKKAMRLQQKIDAFHAQDKKSQADYAKRQASDRQGAGKIRGAASDVASRSSKVSTKKTEKAPPRRIAANEQRNTPIALLVQEWV